MQDCQIVNSNWKQTVGLHNSGAICYLISLLQIWFRNCTFRRGIYAYKSNDDGDVGAIIKEIFGYLQYSKRKFIDVDKLTNTLGLAVMVQQDALEFNSN